MTDRREFLGTVLAAGLVGRTGEAGGSLEKGGSRAQLLPHASPRFPTSPQSSWDVSWTTKITGTHRVVFDSPEMSAGLALIRTLVWFKDYAEVYGAKPADMSAVVVLRHNAIWMVMNDEFWDHHNIGKVVDINDPKTGRPIRRNPFLGATPFADLPPAMADEVLKKVLASATVLACNLAFHDVVDKVKPEAGGDADRARAMALRHLVPGVILQPSGVFGVTRAEEAGCGYFLAS
jgi:hypothetical protein